MRRVVPSADVDLEVALHPERLTGAEASDVMDGIACIHGYDPGFYSAATWAGAQEITERERGALARVDEAATDAEDFYELAFEEEGELVHELELGVCAACYALCAAGSPTFASCRGHQKGAIPWVLFACDAPRGDVLVDCLREARCGAELEDGLVRAWTRSISGMIALASAILRRRQIFDALPVMVDREEARGGDASDWR